MSTLESYKGFSSIGPTTFATEMKAIYGAKFLGAWTGDTLAVDGSGNVTAWNPKLDGEVIPNYGPTGNYFSVGTVSGKPVMRAVDVARRCLYLGTPTLAYRSALVIAKAPSSIADWAELIRFSDTTGLFSTPGAGLIWLDATARCNTITSNIITPSKFRLYEWYNAAAITQISVGGHTDLDRTWVGDIAGIVLLSDQSTDRERRRSFELSARYLPDILTP